MYRASFVGGIGYCARDRRRSPLSGSEQRACWTGPAEVSADGFFSVVPSVPLEKGLLEVASDPLRGPGPVSGR